MQYLHENSKRWRALAVAACLVLSGVVSGGAGFISEALAEEDAAVDAPTTKDSAPLVQTLTTSTGPVAVTELADGLNHPWGMAFLPDGRLLVTERNSGNLRILNRNNILSAPLEGTPEVYISGQGGLLDVALDPDFANNRYIYLAYAAPVEEKLLRDNATLMVGRGHLVDDEDGTRIEDFTRIFRQKPPVASNKHFGGRLVFSPDGHLYITTGERYQFEPAQDLGSHLGKTIRIAPNGAVPPDNPFAEGALQDKSLANGEQIRPEIWSYGHRNIEAAAFQPGTDALWVVEMGPKGGDELNLIEPGQNYGWPLVSWGTHYSGKDIPDPPTRPDLTDAVRHWTPTISPSGMIFYTGAMFPEWKGSAFIGGLTARGLVRLSFEELEVTDEERLVMDTRIRDVAQAPDGALYVLTDEDNGKIWRLSH